MLQVLTSGAAGADLCSVMSAFCLFQSKVDTIHGDAKFVDEKLVEVNGEKYTADHILIAVGGHPTIPPIPGCEHAITSDGFFELETLPRYSIIWYMIICYCCMT